MNMYKTPLRPLVRSLRTYSTTRSSISIPKSRYTTVTATSITVLAISTFAYVATTTNQKQLLADSKPISVLDQPSLKSNIHKPDDSSGSGSGSGPAPKVIEKKEEEAVQPSEGAFNEETGEINWDCPCLGGMADGPCGENFKAAFSCFVYSEAEPKGIDCVDKFKMMQDCFREHPDIYGEEIDDEEESQNAHESEPAKSPLPNPDSGGKPAKLPNSDPPPNSPILGVTQETTPAKGVAKLVPNKDRYDKARDGPAPARGGGGV